MKTITKPDQWLGVEVRHFAALDAVAPRDHSAAPQTGSATRSRPSASRSRRSRGSSARRSSSGRAAPAPSRSPTRVRCSFATRRRSSRGSMQRARTSLRSVPARPARCASAPTSRSARACCPGHAPLPQRLAGDRARALGAGDRPGAVRADRVGRARPRVLQPPASGRPFRHARADERPLRAPRPGREPARSRSSASLDDLAEQPLIGSNTCASGVVVEHELGTRGLRRLLRLPLGRQRHRAGPRRLGIRRRAHPAAGDRARRRARQGAPLRAEVPRRQVAVVWHRDRHRSPAARAFIEIARDVSADVERQLVEP